jgi:CHAD domain-containing protein
MAYRLKRHEPIVEGLQRVVREEFAAAAGLLARENATSHDRAIHEARKSVKKIRGILRLLRPQLGKQYKPANVAVGEIGRQLSSFRDASAMISTVDALQKNFQSSLGQHTLQPVRRALLAEKKQDEQQANVKEVVLRLAQELTDVGKSVDDWKIESDGFSAIEPGLTDTLRRGRKAFQKVQKHHRAELYHDWRKRVKDHWYHVRLLEPASKDALSPYQESLKNLETWLGDDHNLVVLRQKIHGDLTLYGSKDETDLALDLINQHQRELRGKAMELGERLYQDKPAKLVTHLHELWQAWHQ